MLPRLKLLAAAGLLSLTIAFGVTGCESLKAVWHRPETQTGVEGLTKSAFAFASAAAAESVRQLATTGTVDAPKVAMVGGAAALWTAANYIRQLQGTASVLDTAATAAQLAAAGIPAAHAATLADAITSNAQVLAAQGVNPNAASEINASAFDAAAAAIAGKTLKN